MSKRSALEEAAGAPAFEPAPPLGARAVVCVQGLGFVGSALAIALASGRGPDGAPRLDVVGVDLPTPDGLAKVDALNAGVLPVASTDGKLIAALAEANRVGNLRATTDPAVYEEAAVAVVDVPLDLVAGGNGDESTVRFGGLRAAVRTLGERMRPGSLVLVETTVPPGTTSEVIAPELAAALAARGLPADALHLAHSYERVMPGDGYFDSVVNYWRCYAGHTESAADACEAFLTQLVNVAEFPLTRLHSTTASETAKVLENAYRATTIALMEEWGRFAESVGVDLFEVIDAIRLRPTHVNMRQPGFGVGGYCLTKDPLFGEIAARELFGRSELTFPFSRRAVEANRVMPLVSVDRLEALLPPGLAGRRVVLMGVSYRPGVADTRHSASADFVLAAQARGAAVLCHDPLVAGWPEVGVPLTAELPSLDGVDAVVFAVAHAAYAEADLRSWLGDARPLVLDANRVLGDSQRLLLRGLGCRVESIGRGPGL